MADVLSKEQVDALRNATAEPVATETTTEAPVTQVETKGAGVKPAPSDAIMASPGEPYTFDVPSASGTGVNKLTIAKPTRPVALLVAKVLGFDSTNDGLMLYFRALCWLTHINGQPLPSPLMTRQDFEDMSALIGDDALDALNIEVLSAGLVARVVSREALEK